MRHLGPYEWVMYVLALVLAATAGFLALRFCWRYRKVNWRATDWGRQVMYITGLLGVVLVYVPVAAVMALLGWYGSAPALTVSALIYAAVAWVLWRQNRLEGRKHDRRSGSGGS